MVHARTYHDQNGHPYQANAGAVVVLDANTGGVVAMVSNPDLDPSWYVHGLTPQQEKYLTKNANAPSVNRATQLTYQPGSTFKSITGLTAMKEGFATMSRLLPLCRAVQETGRRVGNRVQQLDDANLG